MYVCRKDILNFSEAGHKNKTGHKKSCERFMPSLCQRKGTSLSEDEGHGEASRILAWLSFSRFLRYLIPFVQLYLFHPASSLA